MLKPDVTLMHVNIFTIEYSPHMHCGYTYTDNHSPNARKPSKVLPKCNVITHDFKTCHFDHEHSCLQSWDKDS